MDFLMIYPVERFDWGYQCEYVGPNPIAINTGAFEVANFNTDLTGTTGTFGKITLSPQSPNLIEIENRTGNPIQLLIQIICPPGL